MTLGTMLAVISYASQVLNPVNSLLQNNKSLQYTKVLLSRYFNLIEQDNGDPLVIHDNINQFSIKNGKGDKVHIKGCNGSGKTTLIDLITGIITPSSGIITINGNNIIKSGKSCIYSRLCVIPQEPILISGTIFENIVFGREFSITEVQNLVLAISFDDWIFEEININNFKISHFESNLSGG